MKLSLLIAILTLIALISFACSTDADEDTIRGDMTGEEAIEWVSYGFETHVYLSRRVHTTVPPGGVMQASIIHSGTIYYCYVDMRRFPDTETVVVSYNVDTGETGRMVLPFSGNVEIAGMNVTDEGNLAVFVIQRTEYDDDTSIIAFYGEYDMDGNELYRRDFGELFDYEADSINVEQAIFVGDDYIVLLVRHLEWRGFNSSVHIIDFETGDAEVLYSEYFIVRGMISDLGYDRIVVCEWMLGQTALREVIVSENSWGDVLTTIDLEVRMLFQADGRTPYDLIIVDDNFLYTYNLEQGELTALLSLAESEIHRAWGTDIGFFEDGRIYVLSTFWNPEEKQQESELHILTPVPREILEERTVLTLGGVNIGTYMHQEVARFNLSSSMHEIVVEEYNPSGDPMEGTWDAFSRLQIELMTGRGPDIIYNASEEMATQGLLLDLHPFILADRDLSKDDFVPSFLASLESPEGRLYMLANKFMIDTLFGTTETLGHIESWTADAFLELLEENSHMEYPLGIWMSSEMFVNLMLGAGGEDFVDWAAFEANFDSDAFVNILEIAKYLHDSMEVIMREPLPYEPIRLRRGEQLIMRQLIFGILEFFIDSTIIGDFVAIGYPTENGGVHRVRPRSTLLGMNAATEHPDAAWEFLRHILLPSDNIYQDFPLRIDMFDELIENLQVPQYGYDEDGYYVEIPRGTIYFDGGGSITLYTLTEEAADILRAIVETAQPDGTDMFGFLWHYIISEDLAPFFAGSRTAEETARITQSRAQIFLAERQQ